MTPKPVKVRAYTTRKLPDDFLHRMRILAAFKAAEEKRRVTLEEVVNEVIAKGLPIVEKATLDR